MVIRGSLAGYEDHGATTERLIRVIGRGTLLGPDESRDGAARYLTTVAPEDSEVIVLSIDQLRGVIAANHQLGDLIPGAFVARRALLVGLAAGLRLVGSRLSPDTRRLPEFLARNRIPHGFVDVESDEQAEARCCASSESLLPRRRCSRVAGSPCATRPTARWRMRATSDLRGRRPGWRTS